MERDPLPKDLRAKLNRLRLPTKKELDALLKRLTSAQRQMTDGRISDMSAKFRRSQFNFSRAATSGSGRNAAEFQRKKGESAMHLGSSKIICPRIVRCQRGATHTLSEFKARKNTP
jgi:hypothetical protein